MQDKNRIEFRGSFKVVNGVALDSVVSIGFILGLIGKGLDNASEL